MVGPSPLSDGCRYLFMMIDRTTCWPEVALVKDMTAALCAVAFSSILVARFGEPATLVSDRGP